MQHSTEKVIVYLDQKPPTNDIYISRWKCEVNITVIRSEITPSLPFSLCISKAKQLVVFIFHKILYWVIEWCRPL